MDGLAAIGYGPLPYYIVRNYGEAVDAQRKIMAQLAAGQRILSAADDPAGLAISERLLAQIRQTEAAIGNIENAMAYTRTAEGWLQTINDTMGRMGELAVTAHSGILAPLDRRILQMEFAQMQQGIQQITTGPNALAKYNGIPLFQGGSLTVQTGPESGQTLTLGGIDLTAGSTVSIGASGGRPLSWSSVVSTGAGGIGIGTQAAARVAVGATSLGSDHVSLVRATLGAQENRLGHSMQGMRDYQVNLVRTNSRIRDVDYARELINFARYLDMGRRTLGLLP
ncbi:MAG: hypothetical protein JXR37_26860 [Kiritimatiellae bacterium]|nr:hypothetical protein [Kiritimatiellia bacterium]